MTVETLSKHGAFGGEQSFHVHASEACAGPMKFSVYVPPQAQKERRPALYYLAGLTCTEETFVAKAGAQRVAAELGLVLVTCDTSPRAARFPGDDESWDFGQGAGFYLDATEAPWSSAYRMETYVTHELRELIEAEFPVDTKVRGLFGHSMGGHGALSLSLRFPSLYQSVSAFAPICAPSQVPWGEKAFSRYLGSDKTKWAAHDTVELLATRRFPGKVLVDQGTADKFLERELRPELLEAACAAAGQELLLRRHGGYDHGYYFIASFVEDHLRHHASALLGLARNAALSSDRQRRAPVLGAGTWDGRSLAASDHEPQVTRSRRRDGRRAPCAIAFDFVADDREHGDAVDVDLREGFAKHTDAIDDRRGRVTDDDLFAREPTEATAPS